MNKKGNEFYERAIRLGHDVVVLQELGEVSRCFTCPTIEEINRWISVATPAQREKRQKTFFNPPILLRQRLGQGMHDRCEAVIFANGRVEKEADREGLERHFPIMVKAISIAEKIIPQGEVWDVTATALEWGRDTQDEIYTILNVGRLVFEEGSHLIIRGNVFSFLCQEMIIHGKRTTNEAYQIGILPTPFSVDFKGGELDGCHGKNGLPGIHGIAGTFPELEGSFLGPILKASIQPYEMNGTDGANGEDGSPGSNGRNGGMCRIAEITVRKLEGQLGLFVQAGRGGDGGHGGNGAPGGNGGSGADGCKHLTGLLHGGQGGNAGNGGHGGDGGHAGNGGLSSNIYLCVPPEMKNNVHIITLASEGGRGGNGGQEGPAGHYGEGGVGIAPILPGSHGQKASPGKEGKRGKDGKGRSAPYIFLNERCVFKEELQTS